MMDEKLYFAYGSNINLNQMAVRCPDAVPVKAVVLHDYELAFRGGGYGVATIIPKQGACVHGLLWKITQECEASLDRYEGYPRLYYKKSVIVKDQSNTGHRVMAYIMAREFEHEPAYPSAPYFEGIKAGCKMNGIPVRPLYEALTRTKQEIERFDKSQKPFYQVYFDQLKKGKPPKRHER